MSSVVDARSARPASRPAGPVSVPSSELGDRFAFNLRTRVRPLWPLRLPGSGMDGVARRRDGLYERLMHVDDAPVVVRAALVSGEVVLGAWADDRGHAEEGLTRLRAALGVDLDLGAFVERFRWDPLIGASVRRRPGLRPARRLVPFEALAWAVCEQLIEYERAVAIERRIVHGVGRVDPHTGLRDLPSPKRLAGVAPAQLCAWDLAERRAITLRAVARLVARRGADLDAADHERGWSRLRAIPGVGQWTIDILALHGQGRLDVVPAGDLNYLKLVGRLLNEGDPDGFATEDEVRELFSRYGEWAGLAATHALGVASQVALPSRTNG